MKTFVLGIVRDQSIEIKAEKDTQVFSWQFFTWNLLFTCTHGSLKWRNKKKKNTKKGGGKEKNFHSKKISKTVAGKNCRLGNMYYKYCVFYIVDCSVIISILEIRKYSSQMYKL